jgi:rare lipoprotein A
MISICRRIATFSPIVVLSLLLGSEASAKAEHRHKAHMTCGQLPTRQVGRAMFYGPGFDGHIMANGEVFDMNAPTAASRTLPLGTRALVTNMRTGRSTIVTITDRGRLRAKNVILDLSVGAARDIGLTEHEGVAPVQLKPLSCQRMAHVAHAPTTGSHVDIASRH